MTEITWEGEIQRLIALEKSAHANLVNQGAKQLLQTYPNNDSVKHVGAGFLIDSGSELQDRASIIEGITIIKALLKTNAGNNQDNLIYNLSNGHLALYEIQSQQGRAEEALESLQKAKKLQQQLLVDKHTLESWLLAAVMTNYANTLDLLGRTIESIDTYFECIEIFPNHATAIGNCGIAIKRILDFPSPHKIKNLYQSWFLLTKACNMKAEILEYSTAGAINWFESHLKNLVEYIDFQIDGGIDGLTHYAEHRQDVHGQPVSPNWLSKINKERLLITMNLNPLDSIEECVDDLTFQSVITKIVKDGPDRFSTLSNSLNLMKEEFVTARYLYFLSMDSQNVYAPSSKVTQYIKTPDTSDFGLRSGLLKASFRLAADCLDKIAIFINDYFELGHQVNQVYFSNVWYKDCDAKKRIIHPVLLPISKSNPFIYALLDVKRDWHLEALPAGPLKDIRNQATHRKLILHWMYPNEQSKDSSLWNADDFQKKTAFLLRIVKASIVYSVLAIDIEEQKKSNNDNQKVWSNTFSIDQGLSDRFFDEESE